MTTLLFTHPASLRHVTPEGHPERVDRIKAVNQILSSEHFRDLARREAPLGRDEDILRAHAYEHLERVRAMSPAEGFEYLDPDTVMSPARWRRPCARWVRRPRRSMPCSPARRTMPSAPCGRPATMPRRGAPWAFACSTRRRSPRIYARQRYGAERVAVVDFDVHHGNGTQDIFWSDADMFYGSTHQMPLYPGTGAVQETGVGNIFNAPLRAGDGSEQFREAMGSVILPALDAFGPGPRDHLGGLRCPPPRSAGQPAADGGGFRLGDAAADGGGGNPLRRPHRLGARGRL